MTFTMIFDGTTTEDLGRPSTLGGTWSRWMRALISFLRSESGTAGGEPPEEPPEEPVALQAAAEDGEMLTLASAYDVKRYRPTYEPLLRPEPEPNSQPPDEPDPPPSGYTQDDKVEGGRPWPFLLLAVLRAIFGDTPPPRNEPKG